MAAGRRGVFELLISMFEVLVVNYGDARGRKPGEVRLHGSLQKKKHVADLERSRLQAVVDSVPVPLFVIDPDGLVSHASEAATAAFGVAVPEMLGRELDQSLHFVNVDGFPIPPGALPHRSARAEGRAASAGVAFDLFVALEDGVRMPVVVEASPVFDDRAQAGGCVATVQVVGSLTEHDPVTGLPNSAAYLDRAAHKLDSGPGGLAIMLIELDRFDVTRASVGNAAGDDLLVEASRRLLAVFEATDAGSSSNDCFLAFLGGNRFGVIVTSLSDPFSVLHLAESARTAISEPSPAPFGVRLRASVGVALDTQVLDAHQLLAAASAALVRARDAGGDRVEVLDEAATEEAVTKLRLEIDLSGAVDDDQIQLHYQPEIDLKSRRLVGFEALARWHHVQLGAISPQLFIALAEDSGIIHSLGRRLLRQACAQARTWPEFQRATGMSVCVNVSAKQLRPEFVDEAVGALRETGLDPTSLTLEVTETAAMRDPETTIAVMDELRGRGVRFALDDFGTGYSSMAYLTRMPFDLLKLDRGFVEGMTGGGPDAVVAQSIVALGRSLGIPVLAEGIERREQAEMLLGLGCEQGQGYLFSRPLSAEAAGALLDEVRRAGYVLRDADQRGDV